MICFESHACLVKLVIIIKKNELLTMSTDWVSHKTNLLAGITVAMALVPEALAFAIVAGVHPLAGLFAVVIVAFITSTFGGRPGMVSAAAGSLAVVMAALVMQHGVEYLFAAVIGMGIIQLIIGWQKWGRFIRMVPAPVMLGFVNGLALIVFMAQLSPPLKTTLVIGCKVSHFGNY